MLRIRLKRMGAKNRPFYRIVVTESGKARTGPFVEQVGHYDPNPDPSLLNIKMERVEYWVGKGAQPSGAVRKLMKIRAGRKTETVEAAEAAE